MAHGLLLINERGLPTLCSALLDARRQSQYWDQVHFRDLKHGSQQDRASLTGREFLRAFLANLEVARFKAFIVDHDGPFPFPFPGELGFKDHVSQGLDAAFLGSLAWLWGGLGPTSLRIAFDRASGAWREAEDALPLRLIDEVARRRESRPARYPDLSLAGPPQWLSSDPRTYVADRRLQEADFLSGRVPIECELLQLVDLLLGATQLAMQPAKLLRSPEGKVRITVRLRELLAESLIGATEVRRLHRRISVSVFPDKNLRAYALATYLEAAELAVQLPLHLAEKPHSPLDRLSIYAKPLARDASETPSKTPLGVPTQTRREPVPT